MNKLIFTNESCKIEIKGKSIEINEYLEDLEKLNIEEETFGFLTSIENQNVEGFMIDNVIKYDDILLYYFYRTLFYNRLKDIILYINILQKLQKKLDNNLIVETNNLIMYHISKDIYKIKANFMNEEIKTEGSKHIKFRECFKELYRISKGIVYYCSFKKIKNKKNVFIFSHASDLNYVKTLNNNSEYFDTQLGSVIKKLKSTKENNVVALQMLNKKEMISKSIACKEKYIPLEIFIILKKISSKGIINPAKLSDNTDNLNKLNYEYNDIDLKEIILKYILFDIKQKCLSYLNEILFSEKFFRKNNIQKCLVIDEGDRGRCFVVAANRLNIQSYAVQHGIINNTSPQYIINSFYKELVPKTTFVWGSEFKKMLIKGSNLYNDNNIVVTGQVRTDLLLNYKSKRSKSESKIRILYATQYLEDLLEPATIILFKSLNMLEKNYELVIKMHPAEIKDDFYKQKIQEYSIKNAVIKKEGDIYEMIAWSDVVVSVHSTVVLEGALLEKPSICIKLPKYDDMGSFVKDGISLGVRNAYELKEYLENLEEVNINSKKSTEQYINNRFYKVDGLVSERIVNHINM